MLPDFNFILLVSLFLLYFGVGLATLKVAQTLSEWDLPEEQNMAFIIFWPIFWTAGIILLAVHLTRHRAKVWEWGRRA